MNDLAHPCVSGGVEQDTGAIDVDGAEQVLVLGERHLGHVVIDDVDPVDGLADRRRVADVAADELDPAETVGAWTVVDASADCASAVWAGVVRIVEIQDPHMLAGRAELGDEQCPEVAAAARDEGSGRHSTRPSVRHHWILRRIPSYRSISGS